MAVAGQPDPEPQAAEPGRRWPDEAGRVAQPHPDHDNSDFAIALRLLLIVMLTSARGKKPRRP